jgi:ribokinase
MYCLIFVNPLGERTIIGVNADQVSVASPTREMVADAQLLTLDLYGGAERVEAARLASELHRPVVIGDLRDLVHPVLPHTTVAIASAAELRLSYPSLTVRDFASRVLKHGLATVIITDGSAAATVFTPDREVRLMPPAVQVVDTTGAGDAVRAGVTSGLSDGLEPVEYAAWGVAAGSLNVQQPGGANNIPSKSDVLALAEEILKTATRL